MEIRSHSGLTVAGKKIVGRAVLYNVLSENLGGFVENIAPGAFSDCLRNDVRALVEHDQKLILGRTGSGTVRITDDAIGLLVEIDPPNIQSARDLLVSIERGDIKGMSFGFSVPAGGESWSYNDGLAIRTVTNAVLHEVTVTSLPAYSAKDVKVSNRTLKAHALNLNQAYLAIMEVI